MMRDANIRGQVCRKIDASPGELSALNGKAKDPRLSIGKQLSVRDAKRFIELSAPFGSIRVSNTIEGTLR
jgi:hypothetical protein